MDFTNAALLGFIVFALTQWLNKIAADAKIKLPAVVVVVWAIVVGQVAAFLVANSDWGNVSIVNGIHMDKMNGVSLVIVGIAASTLGTTFHNVFGAVRNVGDNQPPPLDH